MVFSGASGVPTPAATYRETTNPRGANGLNTTLYLPASVLHPADDLVGPGEECQKREVHQQDVHAADGTRAGPPVVGQVREHRDRAHPGDHARPYVRRLAFEPLRDPQLFAEVSIDHGAVTWPGELDLAPDAMYDGIKATGSWTPK